MTPFERQPRPITLTAAIVAVALVVLVLASTLGAARRYCRLRHECRRCGNGDRRCGGRHNSGAGRPFRVSVPEAALVDLAYAHQGDKVA